MGIPFSRTMGDSIRLNGERQKPFTQPSKLACTLILSDPVYVAEAVGNGLLVADASGVCTGVDDDSVGAGLGVGFAGVSDGFVVGADKDDWTAVDRNDERGALDAFDGLLTICGLLIGGPGDELDMR